MIRVLVVDDQDIIRAGLTTILAAQDGLAVAGDAADGFAALQLLRETPVDVVLMDLRMPGIDGVEAVRRIRAEHGDGIRIVVLTTFDQDANVLRAIRAGADGFLSKGAGPAELADAVRQVASGGKVLSSTAVGALVGHVAEDRGIAVDEDLAARFEALTPRELEVVEQIVAGYDGAEIAQRLFLSPFTVKTHTNRAMAKVGAKDRGQLVSAAVRAGVRP